LGAVEPVVRLRAGGIFPGRGVAVWPGRSWGFGLPLVRPAQQDSGRRYAPDRSGHLKRHGRPACAIYFAAPVVIHWKPVVNHAKGPASAKRRDPKDCFSMRNYIGHLAVSDPLHAYLRDVILPHLAGVEREPRWRVFRVSAVSDVYLYEDKWTGTRLVGKFYARARGLNGSNAPQSAAHEYRNLVLVRGLGFDRPPDYVVRPLGVNPALGDLLVIEHLAGEQLDAVIDAAVREGRDERLYRKLSALARFLARLHNRTAVEERVDFARTQAYFDRVVAYLAANAGVSDRRAGRLRELGHAYAADPALQQDVQVLVHGDATPSNFLFGRAGDVLAIDLERMHRDDRVYDVGRLCGELKHCFLRATGDVNRAEPFIGHFLWEYAGHFPDRDRAFAAVTGRLPFHLGLTLLRIARNAWLDDGYRRLLVHEAKAILTGGL